MSAVYKVITNDTNILQIYFDCNGNTVELHPGESKDICVANASSSAIDINITKFEALCDAVHEKLMTVEGIANNFAPSVLEKLEDLLANTKPPKPPK